MPGAAWFRNGFVTRAGARPALAIILGVAVVACCGGGATGSPGTSGPTSTAETPAAADTAAPGATETGAGVVDACALISTDQVAAIVGKPVTVEPDDPSADWVAGTCWWNSETMDVRFSVDVGTPATIAKSSSPTTKEQLELFKIASMAPNAVDVPNLGDAAAFGNLMLVATRGESMVSVYNLPQDQATEVAKVVLANL